MRFPELNETVEGMLSSDHLVRLETEFLQLRIRAHKLCEMLTRWDLGMLDFTPTCPREIYQEQYEAMIRYGNVLYRRIQIERADRSSKEQGGQRWH